MVAKKSSDAPTIEEFDTWDEKKETDALAKAARQYLVRHIIKGDSVWYLTPYGHVYHLPLNLSIDDFLALEEAASDSDQIKAVTNILESFAGKSEADRLRKEPMLVTLAIIGDYGETFAKIQGAPLGKSVDSPSD